MNVAGAWRCVENKVIQLAPVGIGYQLLQGAGGHTATPQSGCCGRYKEANRKQLNAILLDRHDEVATILLDGVWALILYIKHLGH